MKIEIESKPRAGVIRVEGDLTLANSDGLYSRLEAWHRSRPSALYIADVEKLTMLDSSGIGAIVRCAAHLRRSGSDLVLAGAKGEPLTALRVAKLDNAIKSYPNIDAALTAAP